MKRNFRAMLVGGAVIAGMSLIAFPAIAFQEPAGSTPARDMGHRWGSKCAPTGNASLCCSSQRKDEKTCKGLEKERTGSPLLRDCEDAEKICRSMVQSAAEVKALSPKEMGAKWGAKCTPVVWPPIKVPFIGCCRGCCSKQRNDEAACKGAGSLKTCDDAEKVCQTTVDAAEQAHAVQNAHLPSPSQAAEKIVGQERERAEQHPENLKKQQEKDLEKAEDEYNRIMDAPRPTNKRAADEWKQKTKALWNKILDLRKKLGSGNYKSKIEPKNDDDPMALFGKEISRVCIKGGTLQQNDVTKWLCQWGADQGVSDRPIPPATDIDPNNPSPHAQ